MWIVRHGKFSYLQANTTKLAVNWGDRSTARLFASEQEALCVIAALVETERYCGYNLNPEGLHADLTNVPSELLVRLQDCAKKLIDPPSQEDWKEVWRRSGAIAADEVQRCLSLEGGATSIGNSVLIGTELLLDLQECALKLAIASGADPAPEAIAAVAEFAQKTLELINDETHPR